MTYSFVKPDSGPSPKDDVTQIRTNFSQFGIVFNNNHTALNNPNQGDHENVIFEKQLADPGVDQNIDVLYCKDATSNTGTQPQLFVQIPQFLPNQNDWTSNPNLGMQLTYNQVNTAGPNQFQSFLAGGYLIYFGTDSGTTVPNVLIADTITLSPAPTKIIVAIATPNTFDSTGAVFSVNTQITSNSTFVINSSGNFANPPIPYSFGWVAIAQA